MRGGGTRRFFTPKNSVAQHRDCIKRCQTYRRVKEETDIHAVVAVKHVVIAPPGHKHSSDVDGSRILERGYEERHSEYPDGEKAQMVGEDGREQYRCEHRKRIRARGASDVVQVEEQQRAAKEDEAHVLFDHARLLVRDALEHADEKNHHWDRPARASA